jgi:hypothetical protein
VLSTGTREPLYPLDRPSKVRVSTVLQSQAQQLQGLHVVKRSGVSAAAALVCWCAQARTPAYI